MARTAAVVIRGAETGDGDAEIERILQNVSPVVFQPLTCRCEPDLDRFSHLQQVINMPMRSSGGFQVVANARTQPTASESAADIGVKTRHDIELTQLPNLDAFHLRHGSNQDVSAFLVREAHSGNHHILLWFPDGPRNRL